MNDELVIVTDFKDSDQKTFTRVVFPSQQNGIRFAMEAEIPTNNFGRLSNEEIIEQMKLRGTFSGFTWEH